jgi:hypothetical protein
MYQVRLVDGSWENIDADSLKIRREPGIPESSIELWKMCRDPNDLKEVNVLVFFAPLDSMMSVKKV